MQKSKAVSACVILCGVIAACASTPLPDTKVAWVPPALQPSLAESHEGYGKLIIKRDAGGGVGMQACNHRVSLDGKPFADLGTEQGVKVFAPVGKHVVGLNFTSILCNSGESALTVDLSIDAPTILRIVTNPSEKSQLIPSAS